MRGYLFAGLLALSSHVGATFYGGADALYWKPAHCPVTYVSAQRSNVTPDPHQNFLLTADYDWGVRGYLGYGCNCVFTDVAYHWLRTRDHAFAERGAFTDFTLPGSNEEVQFANADLRFRYQGVEWRTGVNLYQNCLCVSFFADARWTQVRFHAITQGPQETSGALRLVQQTLQYDAGGVGFGIQADTEIWCGFGASGRISGTGLVGQMREKEFMTIDDVDPEVRLPNSQTQITPLLDIRFAITYERCIGCFRIEGGVGYEIDYLFQVLPYWTTPAPFREFPITGCENIGFSGIFFGLAIAY